MFCVVGLDQQPVSASFKVREDIFDEMCSREGFKPAPYMAKHKWVWVDDIRRMKNKEWEHFIHVAYEIVKLKLTAKLRKELGIT
jgi:predicted DNA-binding protein (MmcQ/YjbR family)